MRADSWHTTVGEIIRTLGGEIKTGPFGTKLKASEYSQNGSGVPVISVGEIRLGHIEIHSTTPRVAENVTSKMPEYLLNFGDIIIGRKGAVDRSAFVAQEQHGWFMGSDSIRIRFGDGCISKFVAYCFLSMAHRNWIVQHAGGTTMASLNEDIVRRIPLTLPALSQQQAIASILGALDDKIKLNRQRNRTLEAMARALFQSWFVDFDPVKAKAAGKQPPGLKPEIAALFPNSFELITPLVPTGWKTFSLNSLCEIGRGSSPRPIHNFMGGDVPWIKIADATAAEGPFIYSTKEYVTKEGSEKSFWVSPGDLILSNSATCGVPIYVGIRGCIHDGWLHFRNLKSISKGFLYHWLHSISEHLIHIADGSVQKNLNTKLVGEQRIVVAPDEILNHFEELNSVVFSQIDCHIRELNALKSIRDTLLPRLISGELRVRDAERIIARTIQ